MVWACTVLPLKRVSQLHEWVASAMTKGHKQPQGKFWLWSHYSSLFPSVRHFSELLSKYFYKTKCFSWSLTFQEGRFYMVSAGFLLLALPLARHLANCRAIVQGSRADGRLWTCPSPVGTSISSQYREKAGKLGPSP